MMQRLVIAGSLLAWLIIAVVVARTNLIGFSAATLSWPNPKQATTVFAWANKPNVVAGEVVLSAGDQTTIHVTVPRAFSKAEFNVRLLMNQGGALTMVAPGRSGHSTARTTMTDTFGGRLPLRWDDLAVNTNTFTVQLQNSGAQEVKIQSLRMEIRR